MAAITLFTVIVAFLPALVVSLVYTLLFGEKRNQFIEAFIGLLYVNAIGFTLLNVYLSSPVVDPGFHPIPEGGELIWILLSEFLFQLGNGIQTFFIWIMVSFIAVLFGQLVIMLKLALQDPLKMKFSNLIQKLVGKEPVSDGYSGLSDRLDNITFEGVEPQPLNPEVISKAWSGSWRDYLLIGLVTIVPSISIYIDPIGDPYAYGILVFAIWMYRFGYPASNRIAKGAGVKLGDRDIGGEMMRGVTGWFFKLNLLLSVVLIAIDAFVALRGGSIVAMAYNYTLGLALAAVPIVYAIIMLPLVEDFSVVLYKKVFESITRTKAKLSSFDSSAMIKNIAASGMTSLIVIGAFVACVFAVTLNYAVNQMGFILFYPGQVDENVFFWILHGTTIPQLLHPASWAVLMLLIPLGMIIFLGVLGSYMKNISGGGSEGFAFFAGLIVSTAIWFILPGMDYLVSLYVTPIGSGVTLFYWLRPFMLIPSDAALLWRIISQFLINVPLYISGVLFIMYYFDFKESWEVEIGVESAPLVHVRKRDMMDSVLLFVGGIIGSIVGVLILSVIIPTSELYLLMETLIEEIGFPDGLELIFASNVSYFLVVVEHNIIRTFLMLVAGPILWMLILWFIGIQEKSKSEKMIGLSTLFIAVITGIAALAWTMLDVMNGLIVPAISPSSPTWPWTFAAELGLRAGILFGILFILYFIIFLLNRYVRGDAGGWWLPLILTMFIIEYFVYDDQFTILAVFALPLFMILASKIFSFINNLRKGDQTSEDMASDEGEPFKLMYVRYGLMSLAVAEILSTAMWVAGIGTASALVGADALLYVLNLLPHGLVEIPTFLFAGAASLRVARDLGEYVKRGEWDAYIQNTKSLLTNRKIWRTFVFIMFFLLIAALIEEHITWIVVFIIQILFL